MRIKRYEFERNNYDIIITESIKLSNLADILIGCDVPRILRDIKNEDSENYMSESWSVINYVILNESFILTFKIVDLDKVHHRVKSTNRNSKIEALLK
jgi:hypothetical protein